MNTLAALSMASYMKNMPIFEDDLPFLRKQYYDLLSCYSGLSVQLDAARFMSVKMQELLAQFITGLSEVAGLLLETEFADNRSCMFFLHDRLTELLSQMTSDFDSFYVPEIYSVLKDFEDQDFCYQGYRFSSVFSKPLRASDFIGLAMKVRPLSSVSLFDLITAKTSRIVELCNEIWMDRQIAAEIFIDSLERYLTVRSELRGLPHAVSLTDLASPYNLTVCSRMQVIIQGLKAETYFDFLEIYD